MADYRILIVEDQREVSRLLHTALATLEHDLAVVELSSAEDAVLESAKNKVDLLVADYRLPGMSGIELMNEVREEHPQVKVILVTGQTDPKIRKEVAGAGADAFFLKPVPIADFLDAVERHLGLVETLLPPEPISAKDEDVQRPLPDLLAGLRQELEAVAVLLLSDDGQVLARAGDLPDKNTEISLFSSLLSIYSAGQKVSHLIGQKAGSGWHVFDGGEYDLIFAPVSQTHAMLILGKGLAETGRGMKSLEIFSQSRQTIRAALSDKGTKEPAQKKKAAAPVVAAETNDKELEPLLKDSKKKMKPAEINEFWDKAVDKHKPPTKPYRLSYDQAKQLGLTPQDQD